MSTELHGYGEAALSACRGVLESVGDSDLQRPTPCRDYTVAELGEHLVRSMNLLASCAGEQLAPVYGRTLAERIVPLAESTLSAWERRGVAGAVPLGSRTLPSEQVYDIVLLELVIHGWDLRKALGGSRGSFALPDGLLDHLLASAPLLITPDKRGKAFDEAVPVPEHASRLTALVAFSGRQP